MVSPSYAQLFCLVFGADLILRFVGEGEVEVLSEAQIAGMSTEVRVLHSCDFSILC